MTIRGLIFLLFLYLLLAWLVVFYVFSSEGAGEIVQRGVFWSAVGVAALMLWLVAERAMHWWRSRAARRVSTPLPRAAAPAPVHEDDAAFSRLIAEADENLSRVEGMAGRGVRDLPLFLIIGTEGCGKSSFVRNSGIDARLLAGQVAGSATPVTSTRISNIWLANQCVFVEIGGRVFQNEPGRLADFLRVLTPLNQTPKWRRFLADEVRTSALRGVILCWDVRTTVATPDAVRVEQGAQMIRDRLLAIGNVFGVRCPVYTVFTRVDSVPYFQEFFARLQVKDEGQVWGSLAKAESITELSENKVWAEADTKRLTKDFNALFNRLNARRLATLAAEPLGDRKPAIYEFPREFKRLRALLVQFLVEAMRPDPVGLSPLSRGFFFSGMRRAERVTGTPIDTSMQTIGGNRGSHEATRIFRPEATQILGAPMAGQGGLVEHWMFSRDFFQLVLQNDRVLPKPRPLADPIHLRYRSSASAAAIGVGAFFALVWMVSWNENRNLINDVTKKIEVSGRRTQGLELQGLQALDSLRQILAERLDQPSPWRMHWGLYTGNDLREGVRTAYFNRLRFLLLGPANSHLAERLVRAGNVNDPVYDWLKTYITTSRRTCAVDSRLIKGTLVATTNDLYPGLDPPRQELVARQMDYYVQALTKALPIALPANEDAIGHAQAYLRSQHGPQQIFEALVAGVRKDSKSLSVREQLGEYSSVLSAPEEVAFEFTAKGREKFEQLAGAEKFTPAGEPCVLGATDSVKAQVAGAGEIREAKSIYYRKYKDAWNSFLTQIKVKPFATTEDAAKKLEVLSDSNSVLLRMVKLIAVNTYFAPPRAGEPGLLDKVAGGLKQKVDKAAAKVESLQRPDFGPIDVSQIFQPAHFTTQPDALTLITEKNRPYVDGLRHLQEAFDRYNKASEQDRTALVPSFQDLYNQALGAEKNLADGFNTNTEGVNTELNDLLLQPLRHSLRVIPLPKDPGKAITGPLKITCDAISPLYREFPFNPNGRDAGLQEVTDAFAPGTGRIWKFQQASLNDVVAKGPTGWEQKPDAKVKAAPELLQFLNRAQQFSDAFFQGGQPHLRYALRRVAGQNTIKLVIDGTSFDTSESGLRKEFVWPGPAGKTGADGQVFFNADNHSGFGSYPGLWGVFHLFQYAEPRELRPGIVTWSRVQGPGGQPQSITPVKVELVELPGGVDVFNPAFYAQMACPVKAVVAN